MSSLRVRWKHFRAFEDTKYLDLCPMTVLIGANNAGKTSIFAPLLILKQTFESEDLALDLKPRGEIFNAGSYIDLIRSHDTNLPLEFRLCWSDPPKKVKTKKPDSVGKYPPASLELKFAYDKRNNKVRLSTYTVRDKYDRLMLQRRLLESGRYSLRGIKLPKDTESVEAQAGNRSIRQSKPRHFLFGAEAIVKSIFSEKDEKENATKKSKVARRSITIPAGVSDYALVVFYVVSVIEDILDNISYIGPLRERPRRLYQLSDETPTFVGIRGESAPELLFRSKDKKFRNQVNAWIKRFGFGIEITCEPLLPDAFTVNLVRADQTKTNFADTGFGVSQILPIIVSGLSAKGSKRIIFEQPEIHLNPKLQSLLADLFVYFVDSGQELIVETHSEHFLLRLRRLVAEGKISSDKIALYYVETDEGKAIIRHIPIKPNGHIEPADWPRDFFAEALRESIGLASAQVRGG